MTKRMAEYLAEVELQHGHYYRQILQEQFGRLWLRLNLPDEKISKEPLKLPKIRGTGGLCA